ncbi:PTS system lactose-specific EIICB component [Klebsiella pneumoniae]|nr:PTS system lactose-specific EIICB component [Klebsiella pneumoniae]
MARSHCLLLRSGIFTAILVAIYSTELYAFLKRHNITIRLPPEVPAGVARSFEILIPVLAIILTLHPLNLFIEAQLGMIIPEAIMSLVKPLVAASDTLRRSCCRCWSVRCCGSPGSTAR